MGELFFVKPSMPRAEIRFDGFTPSYSFKGLMDSAVEGVAGVEAVIQTDRKTILVFSPYLDVPSCRQAFAQWSKTVMQAVVGLPAEDRANLEHQVDDAASPLISAMCVHSSRDH